jgi:hypothetical protein
VVAAAAAAVVVVVVVVVDVIMVRGYHFLGEMFVTTNETQTSIDIFEVVTSNAILHRVYHLKTQPPEGPYYGKKAKS